MPGFCFKNELSRGTQAVTSTEIQFYFLKVHGSQQ